MNFNIVEKPEPTYNIDEIIQDYNNYDIPVQKIREKHGLTQSEWSNTILRKLREHEIPLRNQRKNRYHKPRYYYQIGKRYRVQRVINGKCEYFGYYDTVEEAQKRVKELHDNNWNGLIQQNKKKTPRYYSTRLCRGIPYWVVKRTFNKEIKYFGYYKTEAEAQQRVKTLNENNWNGLL